MNDFRLNLLEYQNNAITKKLEEKYGERYKKIRNKVMDDCGLSFAGKWRIHSCVSPIRYISGFTNLPSLIEPDDSRKGFYDSKNNTISISDWSLEKYMNGEVYEVIIHELLHARGYKHGQKMAEEEKRCLDRLIQRNPMFPYYLM